MFSEPGGAFSPSDPSEINKIKFHKMPFTDNEYIFIASFSSFTLDFPE